MWGQIVSAISSAVSSVSGNIAKSDQSFAGQRSSFYDNRSKQIAYVIIPLTLIVIVVIVIVVVGKK